MTEDSSILGGANNTECLLLPTREQGVHGVALGRRQREGESRLELLEGSLVGDNRLAVKVSSRNLLFAARRALLLGIQSSSSTDLETFVERRRGMDRIGCSRGFLYLAMKDSTHPC